MGSESSILTGVGVLRDGPGLLVLGLQGGPRHPAPSQLSRWPLSCTRWTSWGQGDPGVMEGLGFSLPLWAWEEAGLGQGWGGVQTPLLPSRNGISKWNQRMGACPESPLNRKGPELRLEELGAAIPGPRGELGGAQRGSQPLYPLMVLDWPSWRVHIPSLAAPGQGSPPLPSGPPTPVPLLSVAAAALTVSLLQWLVGARPRLSPARPPRPWPLSGDWPKPSRRSVSWPSTSA